MSQKMVEKPFKLLNHRLFQYADERAVPTVWAKPIDKGYDMGWELVLSTSERY